MTPMTVQSTSQTPLPNLSETPVRLAVLQRVCTSYRLGLFLKLSVVPEIQLRLFIGDDIPNSKVRNISKFDGVDTVQLATSFVKFKRRVLPWNKGLIKALETFQPEVILCEGESNFLNYLQAIWYRRRYPNTSLIHWSLGGLPGTSKTSGTILSRFKYRLQKNFDAFLVYSSFGKEGLIKLGHPAEKIIVATNVANTSNHIGKATTLQLTKTQARKKLGIPNRFTVLYSGTMDAIKRPDLLLSLAKSSDPVHYNYVLLGDGVMLEQLRLDAKINKLKNVFLPGRVSDELPLYYRASDVMVLPGRGGMVISEAMAWSLPVIVYQADGTEYDLVQDNKTGFRLNNGDTKDFYHALETLRLHRNKSERLGARGKQLLENRFTLDHMTKQVVKVIFYAKHIRSKKQSLGYDDKSEH